MKIGVFDSGLGGLTVVNAITKTFNNAKIFYIADTQVAPYGEKSKEQILQYSVEITKYLVEVHHIDALIVACNTATSAAISYLRKFFPHLIVIGTEPGIKPAINTTTNGKIGVLATPATLKGDKYQLLVNKLSLENSVQLYEQACPGLVEQIELGNIETSETISMLEKWLQPMQDNHIDTIVLGCTHYPLVSSSIRKIMGEHITLIETSNAIAHRLKELSPKNGYQNCGILEVCVYSTGDINLNMIGQILKKWEYCGKIMVRGLLNE